MFFKYKIRNEFQCRDDCISACSTIELTKMLENSEKVASAFEDVTKYFGIA